MEAAISPLQSGYFDPDRYATETLENEITELAASITVATARMLLLIAELDRREPWGAQGLRSCAHWLNWKLGIDLGAAREKVRVARALDTLPAIRTAFSRGEVSYSKVRAMTRVATVENEDYLLMIARHGTAAHVERLVRGYRRVKRLEEAEAVNAAYAERGLHYHWDEDGMLVLSARIPADAGVVVLKALQAAMDNADESGTVENVSAETSDAEEPFGARRADALCRIAEQHLVNAPEAVKQADRYQVVVHVDAEALREDGQPSRCEIEHGPPLAAQSVKRIACDASLVTVHTDRHGTLLDIGRKRRSVPPPMRRALSFRDRGCRFPGCTQHRVVDAHHVRHWADGGETSLANLVLLCRHHHRLVHEGGFGVQVRDDGKFLFFDPNEHPIADAPVLPAVRCMVEDISTELGIDVSAETLLPVWSGESMDSEMAVAGLLAVT